MWSDERIVERLNHWHEHIGKWFALEKRCALPALRFVISASGTQGKYYPKHKTIVLNRVWLLQFSDEEVDELIAHELCHHWQKHLFRRCKWHGEMFLWLLRVVCGFKDARATGGHDKFSLSQRKIVVDMLRIRFCKETRDEHRTYNQWKPAALCGGESQNGRKH